MRIELLLQLFDAEQIMMFLHYLFLLSVMETGRLNAFANPVFQSIIRERERGAMGRKPVLLGDIVNDHQLIIQLMDFIARHYRIIALCS